MTAPTILALVRHGESAWIAEGRFQGRGDPPLSDAGLRQAAAVGARLAGPRAAPAVPVPDSAPRWPSGTRRCVAPRRPHQAIHEAREADAPLRPLDDAHRAGPGRVGGPHARRGHAALPGAAGRLAGRPIHNHAPGGESLHRGARARPQRPRHHPRTESSTWRWRPMAVTPAEPVLGYERTTGSDDGPDWAIVVAHDGILRLLMLGPARHPHRAFLVLPVRARRR